MFNFLKHIWKVIFAVLIPFALIPLLIIYDSQESKCAYVILWMACYFIFEPIPTAVTSLFPIVLFPILGIMSTSEVTPLYFKDIVMMFLGSLIIAAAVEHCNLHRRIALKVLLILGTTIRWLMVGFILTTMFLSMWMVNTSTVALMVPIVEVIVDELEKESKEKYQVTNMTNCENKESIMNGIEKKYKNLRKALLLSVSYSSICGGLGTQIGTAPNLILVGLLEDLYPECNQVTFINWMIYNIPGMLLCSVAVFFVIYIIYVGFSDIPKNSESCIKDIIQQKYHELGQISFHEIAVLVVTLILILAWMFRDPNFIQGWAPMLFPDVKISNATPAMAAVIMLFIIPANPFQLDWKKRLLNWKIAQKKVAWGILLIFGGGFAIGEGSQKSNLSNWLAIQLKHLPYLPPAAILSILCIMTAMLTEAISNSSTSTILLPIAYELANVIGVHPLYLMMPLALCASFSFMLPVGSPSCAIAYDAGNMKIIDLIKPGIFLNILCCMIQVVSVNTLGYYVFDLRVLTVNSTEFPSGFINSTK